MTKKKERSESEYLRGENRKLKSENRHLRKELNRLNKRSHLYVEPEMEEDPIPIIQEARCPECQSGLKSVSLGNVRTMRICYTCGYRKTYKTSG